MIYIFVRIKCFRVNLFLENFGSDSDSIISAESDSDTDSDSILKLVIPAIPRNIFKLHRF